MKEADITIGSLWYAHPVKIEEVQDLIDSPAPFAEREDRFYLIGVKSFALFFVCSESDQKTMTWIHLQPIDAGLNLQHPSAPSLAGIWQGVPLADEFIKTLLRLDTDQLESCLLRCVFNVGEELRQLSVCWRIEEPCTVPKLRPPERKRGAILTPRECNDVLHVTHDIL